MIIQTAERYFKGFSSAQGMFSILNHTIVIMSTQSFPPHETLPVNEKLLASERNLRIVVPFLKNLTIYLVYGPRRPIRINVQGDLVSVFRWGGKSTQSTVLLVATREKSLTFEGNLC